MNVRLTPRAQAHLLSAFEHIAADSPAAAADVVARIEHALNVISEFPTMGRAGAIDGTREFAVPRTPYVVIYMVSDRIDVVAVLHGRQERPA